MQTIKPCAEVDRVSPEPYVPICLADGSQEFVALYYRFKYLPSVVRNIDLRFQFQQPCSGFRISIVIRESLQLSVAPVGGNQNLFGNGSFEVCFVVVKHKFFQSVLLL
jgi:hypothetical protein